MMTIQDIKTALRTLNANYGREFYRDVAEEDVIKEWAVQFAQDDPAEVMKAIQNCISTLSYRPVIADIKKRMSAGRTRGQRTAMEAFQEIAKAVKKSWTRERAVKAFNELDPILRKVAGNPEMLTSWYEVSDEAFNTVVMSAIRESYKEYAKREAEYYALPKPLQQTDPWMIEAPELAELPAPEVTKTVDEIIDEANAKAAEHGMVMTPELQQKHAARVDAFLKPMTEKEKKLIEMRDQQRAERFLK